jgi:hypothetical protein
MGNSGRSVYGDPFVPSTYNWVREGEVAVVTYGDTDGTRFSIRYTKGALRQALVEIENNWLRGSSWFSCEQSYLSLRAYYLAGGQLFSW